VALPYSSKPVNLRIINHSALPIAIRIGDLQLGSIPAGLTETKRLPFGQLAVTSRWEALVLVHSTHELKVAQGSMTVRGNAATLKITKIDLAAVTRLLGMSYGAYARLCASQIAWRRILRARAAARVRQKINASKTIQRATRAHLHRAPRTCFICMDSVPWGAMVSMVPEKSCHRTCAACAARHVDVALEDGRMHLRCAGEGCKNLLAETTIKRLASASTLAQRKANLEAANARRVASLAFEDASFLQFCASHTRKCPSCHVIIYRHAGCDHMTCKCGREFDWKKTESAMIGADGKVGPQTDTKPAPATHGAQMVAPRTRSEEQAQLAAAIAASEEMSGITQAMAI